MNRVLKERLVRALPLLGFMGLMVGTLAFGQVPVDEEGNELPYELKTVDSSAVNGAADLLTETELVSLVGPVALYPDDLLAIVLPASTYPLEIVQAARFLENLKEDSSLKPDESWDDSVVALLNYPEVVQMMNEDISWTWKLGEAVVSQQGAVIAAVESFRDTVYTAGNLVSDEHQIVTKEEGVVEIKSVSEKVIYVPYYEPARVVVYSPYPVYSYYPRSYPRYYYPYARDYGFGTGVFWGVTTAFRIGWASDYLHVYHHSYRGHPYYGHTYFGHHYRHRPIEVHNHYYVKNRGRRSHDHHRAGDSWRPRHGHGARPGVRVARGQAYQDSRRSGNRPAHVSRRAQTDSPGQVRRRETKSGEKIHHSSARRESTIAKNSSENTAVEFRPRDRHDLNNSKAVANHRARALGRSQGDTSIARRQSGKKLVPNQTSKRRDSTIRSGDRQRNSQVKATRGRMALAKPPTPARPVVSKRTITSRQSTPISSASASSFARTAKDTKVQRTRVNTESRKGDPSRRKDVKPQNRSSASAGSAKQRYQRTASRHSGDGRVGKAGNSRR